MLTPNWNPDRRTLRQFAAIWLCVFLFLGTWSAWKGGAVAPGILWGLGLLVGLPGLAFPSVARPVYVGMMLVSAPIGWVVSHVLLAVVYFVLFAGLGLVFRLCGRDRLRIRFDRGAATYWNVRRSRPDAARYFRLS
jgi:hypothetical protein